MEKISVHVRDIRLKRQFDAPLERATPGSAGYDLRATSYRSDSGRLHPLHEPIKLYPGGTQLFGTGISMLIADPMCVGIIASRSGLYAKHGVRVGQGVGTIDSDYTGEIFIPLHNEGDAPYEIQPLERIAQLVFQTVGHPTIELVDSLDKTERGDGGFGHSGTV